MLHFSLFLSDPDAFYGGCEEWQVGYIKEDEVHQPTGRTQNREERAAAE